MTATLPGLPAAARILREAMRDKSYRSTPLELVAGRYLRWKRFEWVATEATLRDYEIPLSYLALDYADCELRDFEPPLGTERLREFLEQRWGERSARTRAKNLSILRDYFRWCVREGLIIGDPTVAIRSPKRRGVRRNVIGQSATDRIIAAATRPRDRVAAEVLFYAGARKSELAGIRLRDYDHDAAELTLTGKGGKVLDRASARQAAQARHTPITEIVRDTGNLKLAQLLAGHASIKTTADIYAHLDLADLAEALQIVAERRAERRESDARMIPIDFGLETLWLRRMMEAAGIEPASTTARRERLQA